MSGKWARGEHSYFICQRSGVKTLQSQGCIEPGTGLMIAISESDGIYNAVDHPQNKPPVNRLENLPQRFALSGKLEIQMETILDEDDGSTILDEDSNPILQG